MDAVGIAVLVVLVILVWGAAVYNRFIRLKHLMHEAWSGMDVQLKRRHDLIPNIVEAVKGYSRHERGVLEDVTALRGSGLQSEAIRERGQAESALTHSIKTLFAVAEAYPDLQASGQFLSLQQALAEVEEQIQYARRYYNGTVRNFNILAESFPSNLIAGFFAFRPADYFEIELATQREAPEVKL